MFTSATQMGWLEFVWVAWLDLFFLMTQNLHFCTVLQQGDPQGCFLHCAAWTDSCIGKLFFHLLTDTTCVKILC